MSAPDLRDALRLLTRHPRHAAFVVPTLAVAVAASTVIFSFVNALVLEPLPMAEPDRVVLIFSTNERQGVTRGPVSAPDFLDWRADATSFEELAASTAVTTLSLESTSGPVPARGRRITSNFARAWGLSPELGSFASFGDDRSDAPVVLLCDEYQSFATVGEADPAGDEKAFALTRQCRLVPIVATQSISSLRAVLGQGEAWRALLQTLRTRIFLSLSDDASAQIASGLCGQVARMKASYTVSEHTARASASLLSGAAGGGMGSVGASKAFSEKREPLFHPRDFTILGNCQAIVQPYDGSQSLDATRCYLKPDFLARDRPYWRAREAGEL